MKRLLFFIFLLFSAYGSFSQPYISMPADSASWRYRIYDVDYLVQVFDFLLFVNGTDTVVSGNTYHKIYTRSCLQTGPIGFDPPIAPMESGTPDVYYGGIRESGKQVFFLDGTVEQLIFDFNAAIGDSIPATSGKQKVTSIDSINLDGVYHKRYLTTDTGFYIIEGVGSNVGLIPALFADPGNIAFYCFTHIPVYYSPDTTIPCTYIYPLGYSLAASNISVSSPGIKVYPVPANDILHINSPVDDVMHVGVLNDIGQVIWSGDFNEQLDIPVISWPKGLYFLRISNGKSVYEVRKILVE